MMYIGPDDLPPRLARAFREKVRALSDDRPDEETSPDLSIFSGRVAPLLFSVVIVGLYASCYLDASAGTFAVPVTALWGVCLTGWLTRAAEPVRRRRYSPEVVRAVFPLILRTRAERVYYDTLLFLIEEETPMDEQTRRDTLRRLNALLESRYRLDTRRIWPLRMPWSRRLRQ